ncbi:hypothetical protein [Streptomyces sp. RFCAC02]|uniref:hypothetical protein n=1 Tax=Streptomyces sp. RFCAC02 TaxID=2499143 RepID=UPI00101F9B9E|nr:hypothetical protein [Streptomyces sp. RFCAC02]
MTAPTTVAAVLDSVADLREDSAGSAPGGARPVLATPTLAIVLVAGFAGGYAFATAIGDTRPVEN